MPPNRSVARHCGVEAVDHEVGQQAQLGFAVGRSEVLEVAEADEAGRHPRHDCRCLGLFAVDGSIGAGDAQRPSGRDAQAVHGLAAHELADARTQHRAPVASARIGGAAGTFQLKLEAAVGLTQENRPAVSQLAGPDAELVAAVHARQRFASCQQHVARQNRQRLVGLKPIGVETEHLCRRRAAPDPIRRGQGSRTQPRMKGGAQFGESGTPSQAGVGCGIRVERGFLRQGHAPDCRPVAKATPVHGPMGGRPTSGIPESGACCAAQYSGMPFGVRFLKVPYKEVPCWA